MKLLLSAVLCAALSACAGYVPRARTTSADCNTTQIRHAATVRIICPRPLAIGMDGVPVQ